MPLDDYTHSSEHVDSEQLDIAIRALHTISAMPTAESEFLSSIALDALKEMETYGILYNFDEE